MASRGGRNYIRTGAPKGKKPRPPIDRAWGYILCDIETRCWVWQGGKSSGYGVTNGGRNAKGKHRNVLVHRIMYEHLVGPIPEGLHLDHLCRNRACCNPGHLEPVTAKENLRRGEGFSGVNARKTECLRGHPYVDGSWKVNSQGSRLCFECDRIRARRAYHANVDRINARRKAKRSAAKRAE